MTEPEIASNEQEPRKEKIEVEDLPPGGFANWPLYLSIFLIALVLDHVTKYLAIQHLKPTSVLEIPTIQIIPNCFRLIYAENRGAAFSLFHGKVPALAIFSTVASIGVFYWFTRVPAQVKWGRAGLALILSGAIGNLIDRAFRGYVVDFFDAYIGKHHWPVFNVADSCICVGVGIIMIMTLKGRM